MIDIGANLTNKHFESRLEETLSDAKNCDVQHIIVTGTNINSSTQAEILTRDNSMLYATAGVHPHDASSFNQQSVIDLKALLNKPKVIAVGETGLDFNRNFSTPKEQIHAFEQQLELAITTNMPVFLHERDAFETQYRILNSINKQLNGAVIHCFTGNKQALEAYLDLGFYIGITGWICDERRGQELQSIINIIPNDKLLIETDSPYLTPRTLTGKRKKAKNVPSNLTHIAQTIAELRQQTLTQVCEATTNNAKKLFKI
jgi:TatD DNase family protein